MSPFEVPLLAGHGVMPGRGLDGTAKEMSMNLKPLGDRVVVEREEAKEKTAGGIVLPDTAKDKPQKGKVLAVGDGRITKDGKRRELQVKVGDQVLFTSYAGDEFKLDGDKKVLLMREDDILAVID
jgi:chaperonin GroES